MIEEVKNARGKSEIYRSGEPLAKFIRIAGANKVTAG
jgi:hypothetical protein